MSSSSGSTFSPPTREQILHIARRFGVQATEATRIDEGGDHATWLLDDAMIARVALDPGLTERHRVELKAREIIGPRIPVAIPGSIAFGEWTDGRSVMIDERMRGDSAERMPVSIGGELQLAGFIRDLHGIDLSDFPPDLLPRVPDPDMARFIVRARQAAHDVPTLDLSRADIDAQWPRVERGHHVVLHNDLKGEHILVDRGGGIAGIIDWTDIGIGDAAWDVGGLTISIGAQAAWAVCLSAGHAPETIERGIAIARLHTVYAVARRARGEENSPEDLLMAQFRRAWEGIMPVMASGR